MGRKPLNGVPMTPLERQRRHRTIRKLARQANAHRLKAYEFELLLTRALKALKRADRIVHDNSVRPFLRHELQLDPNGPNALEAWMRCFMLAHMLEQFLDALHPKPTPKKLTGRTRKALPAPAPSS
jgi:hypothetical protein